VPASVLRLGPDDPAALAWLRHHWGTTQTLRQVAEDIGAAARGRPVPSEVVFAITFWSADWRPWRALAMPQMSGGLARWSVRTHGAHLALAPVQERAMRRKTLTHRFLAILRRFTYLFCRNDSSGSREPRSSELRTATDHRHHGPSSICSRRVRPPAGRHPNFLPITGTLES
jgi:hypothetical protein